MYVYGIDPDESAHPMDIVQGTGAYIEGYEMVYIGPDELQVRWDEVYGQAWSIAMVSGWTRNNSNTIVKFDEIVYRVRSKDNTIIWEETDARFERGFALQPMEYINFDIMPICNRPAKIFEIEIVGAQIIER